MMKELSWNIETIEDTDYDGVTVTYLRFTPVFNGVIDGFVCSYPIGYDQILAKNEIKEKMTAIGITWDSEI